LRAPDYSHFHLEETIVETMSKILSIYIRPEPNQAVLEQDQVLAVPGKGLKGEYSFADTSKMKDDPGCELTLIENEVLKAIEDEQKISLHPGESRRNLITEGISLKNLVGKEFRVGEVTLKGIRLCEPCAHLAKLIQKEVLPALVHRGGLRAQILTEGIIRVGDLIYVMENDPPEEKQL
jgi:MOSC domain-containing protein YiiM